MEPFRQKGSSMDLWSTFIFKSEHTPFIKVNENVLKKNIEHIQIEKLTQHLQHTSTLWQNTLIILIACDRQWIFCTEILT